MHSVSISMPPSPVGNHLQNTRKVLFNDNNENIFSNDVSNSAATTYYTGTTQPKMKFHSQPMPTGFTFHEAVASAKSPSRPELPLRNPAIDRLKDKRFDSFKTWSGKLERQLSNIRGKHRENVHDSNTQERVEVETLPVDRYFDALQGPELDTLRVCVTSTSFPASFPCTSSLCNVLMIASCIKTNKL